MRRFQNGNDNAFKEIYDRYADRLYAFFISNLNNRDQAQDFTQDLFIKLIDKKDQFDTNRSFKSWIFTVAMNMCRSSFRGPALHTVTPSSLEDEEEATSTSDRHDQALFRKMARQKLAQLSDDHRMVFILRVRQGLTVKEVAEIMECSEGTVKSRLFHATKKLSAALSEFDEDYGAPTFKIHK